MIQRAEERFHHVVERIWVLRCDKVRALYELQARAGNARSDETRVEFLNHYMRERLDVPVVVAPFTTEVVIEDYRLLCAMMRRAGDSDYEYVQELCDRYLPLGDFAPLKTKLQRAQGGRLWRRLLKEYFPELRATRLVLIFEIE